MSRNTKKYFKVLRPLKKAGKTKPYAVIDSETWGLGGKLAFGVIYISDKQNWVFRNKTDFYAILERENIKTVIAHNLDFDAVKIREKSSVEGTEGIIYAGNLLLKFTDENKITWLDSFALLKSSVNNLGESLGYKKLETPDKFINPPKDENRRIITQTDIKYCIRDCKIVAEFLNVAYKLTGAQKLTVASSAMFVFRNKFLKEPLYISELHKEFRKSYYGGRVEAFKTGKVNAKVIDVNSLYPSVMKNIKLPHPNFLKQLDNVTQQEFNFYLNKFEGCAEVTVYIKKQKIGLLPYRTKEKLYFPSGKWTAFYNFNELRFALKHGAEIKEVKKVIFSTKTITDLFTDYVNFFYEKKNTTTGAEQLFYKFLLNSLYGKFGENTHTERIYCAAENLTEILKKLDKKDKTTIHELKRDHFYIEIEKHKAKEPAHQIFSVCSYITSEARIYLAENLLKNKRGVVYCDTDSMAIEGKINAEIGSDLGQWSYEKYTIKNVYGNKFYKTDFGLKAKGIPKNAKIKGKSFEYTHLIKSKESIRLNKTAGATEQRKKKINFEYEKRKQIKGKKITEILNTINLKSNV